MILHPYQIAAAEWLAERKSALLADEMRVGKTGAAIRACDLVGARRVLWLTTASAKTDHARAWRELQHSDRVISVDEPECAPDEVLVTNYDRLKRLERAGMYVKRWDVMVCDESHRLKNPKAQRTKIVFGPLAALVGRTWFLSGTPAPNDPSELWPMLRATMPDVIPSKTGKPMNYWQFVNRYCKTKDNGFGIKIVGAKNMNELRERLKPYVLRRKLAEVMPEIPAQSFDLVYFDAGDALRELETDMTVEFLAACFAKTELTDQQKLMVLDAIDKDVKARIRRLTGMAKVKHVVEWVKDRLEGNNDKIVLFAHHRDVLKALNTDKALNHVLRCYVDGETPGSKRAEHVETFQTTDKPAIFIGQIQAAGEAIDLSAADEVMFVESSWVPKDNQQAAARVVNIGKNKPTFAWFATLADSIDEKIQRTVARKTADLAALFD